MIDFDRLTPMQASSVSTFHAENLGGQLTALGPATIRTFYESVLTLPNTWAWGAFENKTLVGFILASHLSGSLMRNAIGKNPLKWALQLLPAAALHPIAFLRTALETVKGIPSPPPSNYAEVHFIAVRADYRGRGVGHDLIKQLRSNLRTQGVKGFTLSVGQTNTQAIYFYESNGGRAAGDYWAAGDSMRRFIFEEHL